jgi:hypothetical protein
MFGDDGLETSAATEGLWVTITPTSSASPFFDTLLVLVVSPLITLAVVYALLTVRAKIRRRRWRAPKSVVERLPVRTYHPHAKSSVSRQLPQYELYRNDSDDNVAEGSGSRVIRVHVRTYFSTIHTSAISSHVARSVDVVVLPQSTQAQLAPI